MKLPTKRIQNNATVAEIDEALQSLVAKSALFNCKNHKELDRYYKTHYIMVTFPLYIYLKEKLQSAFPKVWKTTYEMDNETKEYGMDIAYLAGSNTPEDITYRDVISMCIFIGKKKYTKVIGDVDTLVNLNS